MEPYTLDRNYNKVDIIDNFLSLIWTERYYGDSQVEMVIPSTPEMIAKLPEGMLLGLPESDELMIIETANDEDNLKVSGISVLPWMDNRFIRTSNKHQDKYWYIENLVPGRILWAILDAMCVSQKLPDGSVVDMGIPDQTELIIPGLGLKSYDQSGSEITIGVQFGPVYTTMRELATTYEIGMRITLESGLLKFQNYKGLDRTSSQPVRYRDSKPGHQPLPPLPIVRFSQDKDSLTNIKELRSIAALKTRAYAFAPGLPEETLPEGTDPGTDRLSGHTPYTGFDLRAMQIFADDITTDNYGGTIASLLNILNERAHKGLAENPYIRAVDGEIVPTSQYKYGVDYNMGDLIEMQGKSGIIQKARVTEYIRAQGPGGETAYPTVTPIS